MLPQQSYSVSAYHIKPNRTIMFFFSFTSLFCNIMFVFTFWDLKFGVLSVCQERFMICWVTAENVRSSTERDSGTNIAYSSLSLPLVPNSSSENHTIWIHIKPFMSDHLIHCCWSSQENRIPQLCRYFTKKHHPFQIPATLSTVHRHIFIFWKKRKTVYDLRWRGENIRLILHRWGELMVFIQFIFYTLCTLIHKDANIQLILCFTLHWFSRGNIYHALSHTELPKREITFSESS